MAPLQGLEPRFLNLNITNIKDYGAITDGIADSSTTIQAAINNTPSGGLLVLPPGIFNLNNKTITISNPMTIIGYGSLINGSIVISNTNNVTISGLITNNVDITVITSNIIKILGCALGNITADKYGAISIRTSCSGVWIEGNLIDNMMYVTLGSTYGCGIKLELPSGTSLTDVFIRRNKITNIHGPAGIWIGGTGSAFTRVAVDKNTIYNTESFGIEVYNSGAQPKFTDCLIRKNEITDTGSLRTPGVAGTGSGGIYNSLTTIPGIDVEGNTVKRTAEVGIEGRWNSVRRNYIEDTGCDQLNHPISDSSGIFNGGGIVEDNIIINPGNDGGIYYYSSGIIYGKTYRKNTIKNVFNKWVSGTTYAVGDLVVSNNNWYVCKTGGVAGLTAPIGTTASISDDVCIWDYKKPFAISGINLNAIGGIQDIVYQDNAIVDIQSALGSSAWNHDITILGNTHQCANVSKCRYFDGSGARSCANLVYQKPHYRADSTPTTGTWELDDIVDFTTSTAGGYLGCVCTAKGTFGTLSGVTGNTTNGSGTITVNDSSSLSVGQVINVAGGVSNAIIKTINGTTLTLSLLASGTVTNAAVSYATPVFKNYGAILS